MKNKYSVMLSQSVYTYLTTKNLHMRELACFDIIYALKKLNFNFMEYNYE
jgi:hypothetical protein